MPKRRRWFIVLAILLVYVSSYYVLSRRGFAISDAVGGKCLYFFEPCPGAFWEFAHHSCVFLYYPLIVVDKWLGTGREPAKCFYFSLSR